MWLLNARTYNLHHFSDPSQDVMRVHEEARLLLDLEDGFETSNYWDAVLEKLSPKIRDFCEFALENGFEWVWIDTCCIDKTSSAELSEGINSMYAWYAASAVCYAFLHDVSDDRDPCEEGSSFSTSVWWTRGWTLQELIAPRCVMFLSREWSILGSKTSLADVVTRVTGIDVDILTHRKSLDDVSVACRMSWASKRRTTRAEDMAYSLMGIFGVNMPTIYGEGSDAFIRLQEEILRRTPDQSLFVWGRCLADYNTLSSLRNSSQSFVHGHRDSLFLASSPVDFASCGDIEAIDTNELSARLGVIVPLPTFTVTGYGIRATLPLLTITTSSSGSPLYLAILACVHKSKTYALSSLLLSSPQGNRFLVGQFLENTHSDARHRVPRGIYRRGLFHERNTPSLVGKQIQLQDLYIPHRPQRLPFPTLLGSSTSAPDGSTPLNITFPAWLRPDVMKHGYKFDRRPSVYVSGSQPGFHTIRLVHMHRHSLPSIVITLGLCDECPVARRAQSSLFRSLRVDLAFEDIATKIQRMSLVSQPSYHIPPEPDASTVSNGHYPCHSKHVTAWGSIIGASFRFVPLIREFWDTDRGIMLMGPRLQEAVSLGGYSKTLSVTGDLVLPFVRPSYN
ncbi:hypothetical protein BD310DRAFT_87820 [Dichomitus squalens]|uniref:Uncharacterized protein n=1 Tax=Dichomitus squalens TaxID=114155 RepID=A0A4V2K922_9APHY|nr:hypothetical protein BD310DRAFT_87820 [Dichomitus squalens]